MRILLFGDLSGWAGYHIGDEAMVTANLAWIRSALPEATVVLVSADPEFTSRIHATPCVPEPSPRRALLPDRSGEAFFDAVRSSDLLFISGAGNLNSLFSDEVRRRTRAAIAARRRGVPVLLTGQTLGPAIDRRDRRHLARWLPGCLHVGLRDKRVSPRIARELGVAKDRIGVAPDDAFLLTPSPPRSRAANRFEEETGNRPVVGICIHHGSSSRFSREKAVALFAKALEPLAVRSGARLLFLPHERVRGRASDIHLGRAIRHALPDPEQACIANARMRDREHLAAIRRCRLVVSSRYHGVVFALGGGVPVVGIADGDYTRTKLTGAFDLSSAPVRVVELDDPELPARLVRAWEEQEERRAEARRASSIARERLQESRDRLRTMIAAL